jgi:hypothetical protein
MRRPLLIATLVIVASAVPSTGAGAASQGIGRCATAKQRFALGSNRYRLHTVQQTRSVWILHTGRDFGDEFFACWKPTGKARRIVVGSGGAAVVDTVINEWVISGRYVAFHVGATSEAPYDEFTSFDVSTLRRRRYTGKLARTANASPSRLVVTPTGALGWLASGALGATDGDGTRVLATASAGPISDLHATSHGLSWTQAGRRHSTTLK